MMNTQKQIRIAHLNARNTQLKKMAQRVGSSSKGDYISVGDERMWLGQDEVNLIINVLTSYNNDIISVVR